MIENRSTTIVLLGVLLVGALIAGQLVAASPDVVAAILAGSVAAILSLALISRLKDDQQFLIRLWLLALGLRVVVASLIYYFGLQDNLAPDWATYDALGDHLAQLWTGTRTGGTWFIGEEARYRSGWGMYYYVASVYTLTGRNPFVLQLLSGILGANTCVLIYRIARMIYPSQRLARLAGILTAIAPSLLIWTSQGLKEPLICFLLSVSLIYTMKLSERMTVKDVFWLLLSLFGLYALRYYVFFVVFVAVAGALLFAAKNFSPKQILQGSGAVLLIGLIFAYYGAGGVAQRSMNLSQMQANREWSAKASDSGYGGNVDITDTRQALVYLPLLTVIFLFAPFPWMIRNINHLVTLPEMILWWISAPFMLRGFWLALRHRLKAALPLCIFTAGLTLAYALYLTNFGTAHRMRVQLLGFLIIFVGIGWEAFRITRKRKRAGAGSRTGTMGRLTPVHVGARSEAYVRNRWSGN